VTPEHLLRFSLRTLRLCEKKSCCFEKNLIP
jgi:hypothetical protein